MVLERNNLKLIETRRENDRNQLLRGLGEPAELTFYKYKIWTPYKVNHGVEVLEVKRYGQSVSRT